MKKLLFTILLSCLLALNIFSQPFNTFLRLNGSTMYAMHNFSSSNIPTGDFTLEFWLYSCSSKDGSLVDAAASTGGHGLEIDILGGSIYTELRGAGTSRVTMQTSINTLSSTWLHYALTYSDSTNKAHVFINGQPEDSATVPQFTPASLFYLGVSDLNSSFLEAQLEELRISDNIRYTSNFTPQSTEFTVDANTNALYHFNGSNDTLSDATTNNYNLVYFPSTYHPVNSVYYFPAYPYISGRSAVIAEKDTICEGESIYLKIDTSVNNLNASGGWAWYSSSCGGSLVSAWWNNTNNDDSILVSPTQTTRYYVRGEGGCAANGNCANKLITVIPKPNVSANASATSICLGDSVQISGSGALNYNWNQGVTNGVYFTPTNTSTYLLTATDNYGCSNLDSITVTVNSLPSATASVSPSVICESDSAQLQASGGISYSWDNNGQNGIYVSPLSTTTYTVTATDANGCIDTAQVRLRVNSLPTVTANASATSICEGTSVTLFGTGTASSYFWDKGVTNGVAFTPNNTDTYTITGTDGTCTNIDTISVHVRVVDASVTVRGDTITANNANATYQWLDCNNGNTIIPGANSQRFIPISSSSYAVKVTENGCNKTSTCQPIILTSLKSHKFDKLKIYPNPVSNILNFELAETINQIIVISINGEILLNKKVDKYNTSIDMSNLASGLYVIKIKTKTGIKTVKIIHK